MCEVTPQKKHLKVAIRVEPKEPPIVVEIATLHKAVPQVLNGLTFVISGRHFLFLLFLEGHFGAALTRVLQYTVCFDLSRIDRHGSSYRG